MPVKGESSTPPPIIGKIGPYTVFITPPAPSDPSPKPELSPAKPVPVQLASPPQVYKEKDSSFGFFWDAMAKVRNGSNVTAETYRYEGRVYAQQSSGS